MFEQITADAGLNQFADVLILLVGGEDENLGLGRALCDLPRGFDAIEEGHRYIEQDYIGPQLFSHLDGLAPVLRFANNFYVAFGFEEIPQPLANDGVIINQQNFDTHTSI